jgi:hypothetical protein
MSVYKLFQINLDNATVNLVNNSDNPYDIPVYKAHTEAMMKGDPGLGLAGDFYKHVADIEAGGLEDVFRIGNIGPEESITRYAPMHSISVGDVVENSGGQRFVVANFGFEEIHPPIAA